VWFSWYRGKVTEVLADENKVDVFFVDYGDSEYLSCSELLPMPAMLRRLPFQAIECSCLDIEPVDIQWNDDVCDKFYDLYYNQNFHAQVSRLNDVNYMTKCLVSVSGLEATDHLSASSSVFLYIYSI